MPLPFTGIADRSRPIHVRKGCSHETIAYLPGAGARCSHRGALRHRLCGDAGSTCQHGSADDHRQPHRRPDADCRERHLDQQPHDVPVPVAPLWSDRRELCRDPRRDREDVSVVAADRGHTLRVRVTAVNADGAVNARSAQTAVVGPNSGAPQNQTRPTISGETTVGELLTADPGTWSNAPTSYAYQWQRCDLDASVCFDVGGATNKAYGVRDADVGYRLAVVVTAPTAPARTPPSQL